MDCTFKASTKGTPCDRCGRPLARDYELVPQRNCIKPGLGDRVASAIKFAARVLHIERWVKETPGCGCKKRREAMNKWGRSVWWTQSAK